MFKLVLVTGVASIIVSGCGGMTPQTRSEFVKANVDGIAFSMVDTHVSNRSFDEVVKSLRQKSDECFNNNVTTTRSQGGVTASDIKDEFQQGPRAEREQGRTDDAVHVEGRGLRAKSP